MNVLLPKTSSVLPSISKYAFTNPKKPFKISLLTDNRISETHFHDYTQIWYTVSGSYVHTINNYNVTQNAGSLVIVFPFAAHRIDSSASDMKKTKVISIDFPNDVFFKNGLPYFSPYYNCALFDKMHLNPFMRFKDSDKDIADEIFTDFLYIHNLESDMQTKRFFANVGKILDLCIQKINTPYNGQNLLALQERSLHISDAIDYITYNSFDKVKVSNASKVATMSRSMFFSSFKELTGITSHEYFNLVRMCRILQKLPYENKAIYEIADECGFSSSSHFHKACIETFGMPPKQLREHINKFDRQNSQIKNTRTLLLQSLGLV